MSVWPEGPSYVKWSAQQHKTWAAKWLTAEEVCETRPLPGVSVWVYEFVLPVDISENKHVSLVKLLI